MGERSAVENQERARILDHASEHSADFLAESRRSSVCSSDVMYLQSSAKSSEESVSLFSPSQSVNLLMKCASYLRFAQASRKFKHTDRDDRRI